MERRAAFAGTERVDLKGLERADLHYLGTLLRGARGKRGLFVLHVKDGAGGAMRIESKVEGFHVIATLVLQSAISQGRAISLATYDNATALELVVRLRTEMIDGSVWILEIIWRADLTPLRGLQISPAQLNGQAAQCAT